MFTEHYNSLTHSLRVMETRFTCDMRGVNGKQVLFQWRPVVCDIWSSLGSPWPDYWWVSHAASVNLWLMTCTCTPCNQTLFKQSVSETEDSERLETVIISPQWALFPFFRDHLSPRQAGRQADMSLGLCVLYWISNRGSKQKQSPVVQLAPYFRSWRPDTEARYTVPEGL